MSELSVFFKQNKPVKANEFFPASADFKDENGEIIKWELRHLTSKDLSTIRSRCMEIKGNGKQVKFDGDLYNRLIVASAVVFPNLRNAELADSYMGQFAPEDRTPENLICLMIDNDGEFQNLVRKVNEMNGLNKHAEENAETRIEMAKN